MYRPHCHHNLIVANGEIDDLRSTILKIRAYHWYHRIARLKKIEHPHNLDQNLWSPQWTYHSVYIVLACADKWIVSMDRIVALADVGTTDENRSVEWWNRSLSQFCSSLESPQSFSRKEERMSSINGKGSRSCFTIIANPWSRDTFARGTTKLRGWTSLR